MNRNDEFIHLPRYNNRSGFEQARKGFKPAFKTAWPYTLLGILFGALLFGLQYLLEHFSHGDNFGTRLLEHLGIGFWVSAIAVFFYEWGSHVKKALEIAEGLTKIYGTEGEKALDLSLGSLLGEKRAQLCQDLKRVIKAVSSIQQQDTWVKDKYIPVIEWLLHEAVLKNALSFEKLPIEGEQGEFHVLTVEKMADKILSIQMGMMDEEDTYDVISDVSSWRDDLLEDFSKVSLQAISSKRILVRRVFNLFRLDLPKVYEASYKEKCEKTISTLKEHLQYSTDWRPYDKRGGYELKVFGSSELSKVPNKVNKKLGISEDKMRKTHFGLFKHQKQPKTVVRFNVGDDLSDITICWDSEKVNRNIEFFREIWSKAEPLDLTRVEQIREALEKNRQP